jgi:hypothetical protein
MNDIQDIKDLTAALELLWKVKSNKPVLGIWLLDAISLIEESEKFIRYPITDLTYHKHP